MAAQGNSEDGKDLRNQVAKFTKHIRVCSLDAVQFCQEVVPTDVLTHEEVVLVCKSVGQQEQQSGLTGICNEIKPRVLLQKKQFQLQFGKHSCHYMVQEYNFTVVTKQCEIELLPLECIALNDPDSYPVCEIYEVSCTTTITRITDLLNDTSTEPPVTVKFNDGVEYKTYFTIPLTSGGHNVTLLPNNRYTFRMVFGGLHQRGFGYSTSVFVNSHLSLNIQCSNGRHSLPMKSLMYKAIEA